MNRTRGATSPGITPDGIRVQRAVRIATVLTIGVLLAAGGFAAAGSVTVVEAGVVQATGASTTITASSSFTFSPSVVNDLPLATAVSIDFMNGDGALTHTFTIIGCENVSFPDTAQLSHFINGTGSDKCQQAPLLNVVQGPSSSKTVTLSATAVTKAGWFEFVCQEPGHLAKGMYGFLGFGLTVPANLTPVTPNTAAGTAVFIIVGTIVTLTVIAIVLGFVVGRREGAKHEMPPERLGYAEPPAPGSDEPKTPLPP